MCKFIIFLVLVGGFDVLFGGDSDIVDYDDKKEE